MQKKINLQKIIDDLGNITRDEDGNRVYFAWEIRDMIKEGIEQALELAAENVTVDVEDWLDCGEEYPFEINTQSILDVINLIE